MEKADPLFLLIGLPTIPIVLILGRMIRWEEAVLKFWRKHASKLPLINYLFPTGRLNKIYFCILKKTKFSLENPSYLPRIPTERNGNSNPASLTRLICGGLILPTIATIFGKFMFQRVHSNFQRTLLVSEKKNS
jgi:E3 ubiquitin-protein ligase MARCH5